MRDIKWNADRQTDRQTDRQIDRQTDRRTAFHSYNIDHDTLMQNLKL